MTALNGFKEIVAEFFNRQRALTIYSLVLLAFLVATFVAQMIDVRTFAGDNVWTKPSKFLFSVAVFALTCAWSFGYVRADRRTSPLLRATVAALIVAGSFEILYIAWQAAQGQASHFNHSTPFHAIMYGLMGVGAVVLVGTTLPLAWEITRRPVAGLRPDYRASVVIGLILCFVLGGGLGGYMAQQPGHAVGAVGGQLPIFGWNRSGGDLRIAHFLGIHAQQAIPMIAIIASTAASGWRWAAVVGGSALYVALTALLFAQAVSGLPLLRM